MVNGGGGSGTGGSRSGSNLVVIAAAAVAVAVASMRAPEAPWQEGIGTVGAPPECCRKGVCGIWRGVPVSAHRWTEVHLPVCCSRSSASLKAAFFPEISYGRGTEDASS